MQMSPEIILNPFFFFLQHVQRERELDRGKEIVIGVRFSNELTLRVAY